MAKTIDDVYALLDAVNKTTLGRMETEIKAIKAKVGA
jgi:hypothetical protein